MTLREGLEKLLKRCDDMAHSLVHAEGTKLFAAGIAGTLAPLLSTADSEQREEGPLLTDMVVRNVIRREFGLTNGDYDDLCNQIDDERKAARAVFTRPGEQREVWTKERHEADMQDLRDEVADLRAMLDRIAAIPDVADCFHAPSEENIADGVEGAIDDLRRKLDDAKREPYQIVWRALAYAGITRANGCPDSILVEEIEARNVKIASSSLTIAALRTALEAAISDEGLKEHHCVTITCDGQNREPTPSESFEFAQGVMAMAYKVHSILAAIPADSLVQEMVTVLSDARGMAHRHYIYDECQDCGMLRGSIDAVLARIGGKT